MYLSYNNFEARNVKLWPITKWNHTPLNTSQLANASKSFWYSLFLSNVKSKVTWGIGHAQPHLDNSTRFIFRPEIKRSISITCHGAISHKFLQENNCVATNWQMMEVNNALNTENPCLLQIGITVQPNGKSNMWKGLPDLPVLGWSLCLRAVVKSQLGTPLLHVLEDAATAIATINHELELRR
jgi:hypothetical protein